MVQNFTTSFSAALLVLLMIVIYVEQACIHDQITMTSIPATTTVHYDGAQLAQKPDVAVREKRDEAEAHENSDKFKPIRIRAHHAFGVAMHAEMEEMLRRVVARAVFRISSILSVVPVVGPLLLSRSCPLVYRAGINEGKCSRIKKGYSGEFCLETFKIPDEHLAGLDIFNATHPEPKRKLYKAGPGVNNTDLILYVIAKGTQLCSAHKHSVMAYAAHCQVDQMGRPVAGLVNFCPLALARQSVNEDTLYYTSQLVGHIEL